MGSLEYDLAELKNCYKKRLMSKKDYEDARRKRLGELRESFILLDTFIPL